MSSSDAWQDIVDDFPRLLVENYCIVASTALLFFDFALTFTAEVQCIWKRKLTGATFVILLMRYSALADRVFFILVIFMWNSNDKVCSAIYHTDDILVIINYLTFAAFTSLRVYGVWDRAWIPLVAIIPLTLVKPILYIVQSAHYIALQTGPPYGCGLINAISDDTLANRTFSQFNDDGTPPVTVAMTVTTTAADALLVVLTWVRTFGIYMESSKFGIRTPLATLLLRDGTIYFILLLLMGIIKIIGIELGHTLPFWHVISYFDQVFTVICLSRLMLNLRGIQHSDSLAGAGTHGQATMSIGFVDFRTSLLIDPPLFESEKDVGCDSPGSPYSHSTPSPAV